jgi:hypothetical protein
MPNSTRVPSWAVTDEMLEAWGFPVKHTEKIMGTSVTVREGMDRRKAMDAAWKAGFVRIESDPVRPLGDQTWADVHGKPKPVPDPEVMAWVAEQKARHT